MNLFTEVFQVNLRVKDMEKAVNWYQEVLGLKVQKDYGSTVVLGFNNNTDSQAAVCLIEHSGKESQSYDENVTHPVLAISAEQAETCKEKLLEMGVYIVEGGQAHFKFTDLYGNLIEAYLPGLYEEEKYEHLR